MFEAPAHPYTRALAEAFPTIGDRAAPQPPRPRRRPARPAGPARRLRVPPRCPVSIAACPTLDVELWPAGEGRRAACVHVRDGHPELVREAPLAPVEDAPGASGVGP